LVWEMCLQMGPVIKVHLPKDRVTQLHQSYGFVEFGSEQDAEYACKVLNGIKLYNKMLRVNKASADKRGGEGGTTGKLDLHCFRLTSRLTDTCLGVGAELFIGNLDPMVTEADLANTFTRFGTLMENPKLTRDDNGLSKGYGFVNFMSFEESDEAINHMNGQYLMNKEITVQYAFKRDGKGERHGDAAERALAAEGKKHNVEVPRSVPNPTAPTGNVIYPPQANPPQPGWGTYGQPTQAPYNNPYNNPYGQPAYGGGMGMPNRAYAPSPYGPGYGQPPPLIPPQYLPVPNGLPQAMPPGMQYNQFAPPPTGAMNGYGNPSSYGRPATGSQH
jgi:splicing factor 3B subunit 4